MIFNLTQHAPTPDQEVEGVGQPVNPALITFNTRPTYAELLDRAQACVKALIEAGAMTGDEVMIGGAPYFMRPLEDALMAAYLRPVYAFSERVCVEEPQADGSVKKTFVFRHAGWVHVGSRVDAEV